MIAVVDHGMGNLGSVKNMLDHLGATSIRTNEPDAIQGADKIILAGVGAFDAAMDELQTLGLVELLHQRVLVEGVPVLGVCLGLQLMAKSSEEGSLAGLGWIDAEVRRFNFGDAGARLPLPHMGWEVVTPVRPSPILNPARREHRFYFSHGYHLVCSNAADVAATSTYGYEFPAIVHRRNIIGTQFHPEKSHGFGADVYRRFIEFAPS